MLACGMEVILVKVAGVGLGIDLVGKNLREIMPLLRRLVSHQSNDHGLMEGITLWLPPSR
jgi:diphthine-ammonia ligase